MATTKGPESGLQKVDMNRVGVFWGRFDLLHVGHLNAFEFCKQHCEHLIVGVAKDDYCAKSRSYDKGSTVNSKQMWNTFQNRVRMVKAMKLVDEVYGYDKSCAFELSKELVDRGIDVGIVFLNPDYEGSALYNESIRQLSAAGIEWRFVPRTSHVSSSQIKNEYS